MSMVGELVDARFPDYVAELRAWTRQVSIAAEGKDLAEMVERVRRRLERAGSVARVYEIPGGFPVVQRELTDPCLTWYT